MQNLIEIALSLTGIRDKRHFHFRQNPRWRPKFGKFKIFHRLYSKSSNYLQGAKFDRNRSYGFRDKQHFPFPPKSKMAAEIRQNSKFLRGFKERLHITQRVQILIEIALSLTVFEINDIFHFRQNPRWRPKFGKF